MPNVLWLGEGHAFAARKLGRCVFLLSMRSPTKKLVRILLAALNFCTMLLLSCGGGAKKSDPPTVGVLSGNWQMVLQQDPPASGTETEAGFLLQSGKSITGQLLLSAQTNCAGLGSVQGTLNGTTAELSLDQMGQTVSLIGIASSDGSSMAGTYSILGSSCAGGSSTGTWTASPVKPVTGHYQASFTSYFRGSYTYDVNVTQAANSGTNTAALSGTMTSTDGPCAPSVTIAGVVSGTSVVFNFVASDGTALGQYTGTTAADASNMTGTYDFLPEANVCANGDSGTISILQVVK
jgi:hypothetical protein